MIEIEMVIPFEIKQDQNQSTDHRDTRALFLLLPQSRVNRIMIKQQGNHFISNAINTIKTSFMQLLCHLIKR
jgi:hypothetical protein